MERKGYEGFQSVKDTLEDKESNIEIYYIRAIVESRRGKFGDSAFG